MWYIYRVLYAKRMIKMYFTHAEVWFVQLIYSIYYVYTGGLIAY